MHLRSITLKGFKSFPDRTRLEFSPGVSVVVGPNGSGKSNITDAVLWAMGEQSPVAVRGQSMQDVIFAGAHGVQARSEAEVEVVLDNADGRGRPAGRRDLDPAAAEPRGGGRVPRQRRALPADGRARAAVGHRARQGDALRRLPGPRGGDRHLQAARPADADRGGGRARQAPQAPPPRAAQARADAGQPGPRAGRGARGAHAAAAAEAPGRGGRAARAARAADRRGAVDAGARGRARGRAALRAAEEAVAAARAAASETEAELHAVAARREQAETALASRGTEREGLVEPLLRGALGARADRAARGRRPPGGRGAGGPRRRAGARCWRRWRPRRRPTSPTTARPSGSPRSRPSSPSWPRTAPRGWSARSPSSRPAARRPRRSSRS